jgi:hypothetical protein
MRATCRSAASSYKKQVARLAASYISISSLLMLSAASLPS